jgi:hypothetical protein
MGAYEKGADLEINSEAYRAAQETLGDEWASISKPWEIRRDAMLDTLTKAAPFTFKPTVQINPVNTLPLSQALNGRLYEKAQIEKKNYHAINAFTLMLSRLELWKARPKNFEHVRLPPSFMSA